jgi:hypothetical protein
MTVIDNVKRLRPDKRSTDSAGYYDLRRRTFLLGNAGLGIIVDS